MKTALIYIEENLASSMALRYTSRLANLIDLALQVIHVEEPENKNHFGTGWTRRTWEHGIEEAGLQEVDRLLKTERIDCRFLGSPVVRVGDRDSELLSEMSHHPYNLYIEGRLNTASVRDFYSLLGSRLYRKMTCPSLIVKNLVPIDRVLLLAAEGVDPDQLTSCFSRLFDPESIPVDLLYFHFQENDSPVWEQEHEMADYLNEIITPLADKGWNIEKKQVVRGTPEKVADLLRDYGLVVSTFPTRKCPHYELLAMLPNPILICK